MLVKVGLLARGVHPLHEPGGMERAVYHLATQLGRLGHAVTLFTRPRLHDRPFPGEVLEVPYQRWRVGVHGSVLDRTLNYPAFAARLGEAVAERVRAGALDVLDAQGMAALGYLRLRSRDATLRAPVVLNPQGMEEHKTRGLKRLALTPLRRMSLEAARLADRIVSTDDVLTPEIPRYLGVDPGKVVLLRNGVDLGEIEAVTPRDVRACVGERLPRLGDAAPVLVSVGRLERYKGFMDVLDALIQLQRAGRLPAGWAWVLLGDGSLRSEMEARIAAEDAALAEHVHFAGWVRDLPLLHACYARADVFVHATHYEGSSIVTIEAMAHGLPVVATRAGGIPDKVEEGVNGFLVEPHDVAGLAGGLARVCNDAALRREMGARSRARVEDLFDWAKIARSTVAVYEELLRPSRA
jgi:glycosyltransferase involved in cell wall biosynthesis